MTYEALTGAVRELAADLKVIGAKVDQITPRQDRLDQTGRLLRKAMVALFALGFVVAVVAIGNLLGSVHTCHDNDDTRAAVRSALVYFEAQTLRSPTLTPERREQATETFGHALSLIPPVNCGAKAIGAQIVRGVGWATLVTLVGFFIFMATFPCGRRFAKRLTARNARFLSKRDS